MSDEQIVKDLRSWAGYPNHASARSQCMVDAAEAIERLQKRAERAEQQAMACDCIEVFERAEKAERELAEARAREEDRQETIRAVLKVLPRQRNPHPDDNLQKLVNLACGLLDDALTDFAPEPTTEREAERRAGNRSHCENCNGSGFVGDNTTGEHGLCPYCHGKGWIWLAAQQQALESDDAESE